MEALTSKGLARALAALLLALAATSCGSTSKHETQLSTPEVPPAAGAEAPGEASTEGIETEEPVERVEPPLPRSDPEPPRPVEPPLPDDKPAEPGDLLVRIGLATDLPRLAVPCCEGTLTVLVDGRSEVLDAPFTLEPASGASGRAEFRVQVAALRDDGQAQNLAVMLSQRTGWPAEAQFDAGTGLYRVRVGKFADRSAAETARRRLVGFGLDATWIVQEGSEVSDPALRVMAGSRSFLVKGRWLAVRPREGSDSLAATVEGQASRWRGSLLVYLNDRGALNLVNELPVEQYLRGVVPRELGPAQYPRLEALKAQAVAARTYALRHLGEFAAEGYDLCASPRCQVYGGLDAEHPLSDRAVAETAGQVLLDGDRLADALYSATCGGHTENGEVVFPFLRATYLRGVPCVEAGTTRLTGSLAPGEAFPGAVLRQLLGPSPGLDVEDLEARLRTLARLANRDEAARGLHLASLSREDLRRYTQAVFGVPVDGALVAHRPGAPERPALLDRGGPSSLGAEAGFDDPDFAPEDADRLLFSLARQSGVIDEERGQFQRLEKGSLSYGTGSGGVLTVTVPRAVATFGREGGHLVSGDLRLAAGDPLRIYRRGGQVVAVVQDVDAASQPTDPAAKLKSWVRWKSDPELRHRVSERYPGFNLRNFEVLTRGVSGRVGKLMLVGTDGRRERLEGLAVRWTLDLPDTLFELKRVTKGRQGSGWEFRGGGWGHGVGLCQVGAFQMAGRGLGYRDILHHYYSGLRLGRAVLK